MRVLKNNILNENEIDKIDNNIMNEMDDAMEFAIKSPLNDEKEIFKDVYSKNDPMPVSVHEKIKKILSN